MIPFPDGIGPPGDGRREIMDMQVTQKPKRQPIPMNGVDTPRFFATIAAVADQPSLAKFQFRANGMWKGGTHCQSAVSGFFGAGSEMKHSTTFTADSDHPAVLCGEDHGPTPVEHLLHALAGCLTAGAASIAAARGVKLESVACSVEGDIDLRGILGLPDEVRNGFQAIRVVFAIKGDAPDEKLRQIIEQSRARSAVFDVLTKGVPVELIVST
ncbi:MAG: OsmC family protein [Rhodopila sp.]